MNLISIIVVIILSPIIYVILRLLYMAYNYYSYRSKIFSLNPSMPKLPDPMLMLKGWGQPDAEEVIMKDLNELGNGSIPPVVFSGPYIANGIPGILISDPELLKEMGDDLEFPKIRTIYDAIAYFLGDGLVAAPHNEKWKSHRHAMNPIFYANKIKVFSEKMTSAGIDMVKELKEKNGKEIDVVELLGKVTQRVLIESLFSSQLDPENVAKIWAKLNEYFGPFILADILLGRAVNQFTPFTRRVSNGRKQLRALLQPLIDAARSDPNPPDDEQKNFIETLVALKNSEGRPLMTDDQIYEECLVMLFAGHDTTKNTISWTIYFLSEHPEELKKLRKEVETELHGHAPTYADIPNLRGCKNAFQESLRMRAPAPQISRCTHKARVFGGYTIPANTSLIMNLGGIMMDAKYWKDPFEYRPDRFNEEELYTKMWLPFSTGHRDCIGKRFATAEGILLIAHLVQNFDFEISKDKKVVGMFEGTLMPKNFFCKFIPVKN